MVEGAAAFDRYAVPTQRRVPNTAAPAKVVPVAESKTRKSALGFDYSVRSENTGRDSSGHRASTFGMSVIAERSVRPCPVPRNKGAPWISSITTTQTCRSQRPTLTHDSSGNHPHLCVSPLKTIPLFTSLSMH